MKRYPTALPGELQESVGDTAFSYGLPKTQTVDDIRQVPRTPTRKAPTLIRNPPHKFNSGGIRVSATSNLILSDNPNRRYLLIQNVGINVCFLGYGVSATVATGIELNPGFEQEFDAGICPNNSINAISPIGTTLIILEGTEF